MAAKFFPFIFPVEASPSGDGTEWTVTFPTGDVRYFSDESFKRLFKAAAPYEEGRLALMAVNP